MTDNPFYNPKHLNPWYSVSAEWDEENHAAYVDAGVRKHLAEPTLPPPPPPPYAPRHILYQDTISTSASIFPDRISTCEQELENDLSDRSLLSRWWRNLRG